jgi:hypothetical protein
MSLRGSATTEAISFVMPLKNGIQEKTKLDSRLSGNDQIDYISKPVTPIFF